MDCADGRPIYWLNLMSSSIWASSASGRRAGRYAVEVTGMQFQWYSGIRVQMQIRARTKPE